MMKKQGEVSSNTDCGLLEKGSVHQRRNIKQNRVSSARKSVIRSNYYRRNNWIQKFANSFSVCYNYYFQKMCIDALPFGFRSLG